MIVRLPARLAGRATRSAGLLAALAAACAILPAAAEPPESAEARGKQIFLTGTSASGKSIEARVGRDAILLPASAVPCASCHGRDGLGRPEGGATPTNITWAHLTKPYGHRHAYGRQHPAFTRETLERAVTAGIDPAGNRLDPTMPRYALSEDDVSDLAAFLARLGNEAVPGVDAATIRVGTVLPGDGPLAAIGAAMRDAMAAYFADVNAAGGIYSRRIELATAAQGATPAATLDNVRSLLDAGAAFALVGAFASGADHEIAALAEDEAVPLVGPFTIFPDGGPPARRFTFYLQAGLREQAAALAEDAARRLGPGRHRVAVVYPAAGRYAEAAEAVDAAGRRHGWAAVQRIPRAPGQAREEPLVEQFAREKVDAVFLFGLNGDLARLVADSGRLAPAPYLFLSGQLADRSLVAAAALPPALAGRVFLAYPALPAGQGAGIAEFARFRERHRLGAAHPAAQVTAYLAARVLVEGLKRAGRDLSREGLVAALEGLYEFDTGLGPVTYGPNRRIGETRPRIVAAGE